MSLAAHEALYHCTFRIGQRSAGKSAVAAAAYRAGEMLTDARTGRAHDYTRKQHVEDRLILTPRGAPAWCRDRGELWSRSELSAPRRDSQVWREVELAIPRDLPRDQYRHFAAQVARPYLDAGAVVDCCFHVPAASDGVEQPHIHMMITLRALDSSTRTGFSTRRNAALEAIFGTNGRGDPAKIVAERERIAEVLNAELRRAGCSRRADHRSYAERADNRQPEPKMGEADAARYRRQRHLHEQQGGPEPVASQRQREIRNLRYEKRISHLLMQTEIDIMYEQHAIARASGRPKVEYTEEKQGIKERLLKERFSSDLDLSRAGIALDSVYRVDVGDPRVTRVQMRDDSALEVFKDGRIRVFGPRGDASALATAIADVQGWDRDTIETLPARVQAVAPKGRYRHKADREAQLQALIEAWQQRGYSDINAGQHAVFVTIGSAKIVDSGDRATVQGPLTDDAVRALILKAKEDWGGRCEITKGDDDFRSRLWLEAQRQGGIEIVGFEPPPHVRAMLAAEAKQRQRADAAVEAVQDKAVIARALLAHLRGDSETAPTPALQAWAASLTQGEARAVASSEPWQVIPQLDAWTAKGKAQEEVGIAAPKPKPEPKPAAEHEPVAPRFGG